MNDRTKKGEFIGIIGGVGLPHMSLSIGRILRACGESVTVISEKPVGNATDGKVAKKTEAVYGLVPAAGGGFWAITHRALYRFGTDDNPEKEYPFPELKSVGGVHLSRNIPGVIVVRTDVNWAVSTSGYIPLIIPVETPQP